MHTSTRLKSIRFAAATATIVLLVSACAGTGVMPEVLDVEGTITVNGNEPFTAVILRTPSRNYYILKMSTEMRQALITPAYRRVIGRLYLDEWNGRDFAHLDVHRMETAEPPR